MLNLHGGPLIDRAVKDPGFGGEEEKGGRPLAMNSRYPFAQQVLFVQQMRQSCLAYDLAVKIACSIGVKERCCTKVSVAQGWTSDYLTILTDTDDVTTQYGALIGPFETACRGAVRCSSVFSVAYNRG